MKLPLAPMIDGLKILPTLPVSGTCWNTSLLAAAALTLIVPELSPARSPSAALRV